MDGLLRRLCVVCADHRVCHGWSVCGWLCGSKKNKLLTSTRRFPREVVVSRQVVTPTICWEQYALSLGLWLRWCGECQAKSRGRQRMRFPSRRIRMWEGWEGLSTKHPEHASTTKKKLVDVGTGGRTGAFCIIRSPEAHPWRICDDQAEIPHRIHTTIPGPRRPAGVVTNYVWV